MCLPLRSKAAGPARCGRQSGGRQRQELAQTTTDGDGHAVLTGSTDKARAVVARREKEMSVVALRDPALDLSEYDVGGHPSRNQKLFVYAGRDLYRPGEEFTVSMLARDADGQPLPPRQVARPCR